MVSLLTTSAFVITCVKPWRFTAEIILLRLLRWRRAGNRCVPRGTVIPRFVRWLWFSAVPTNGDPPALWLLAKAAEYVSFPRKSCRQKARAESVKKVSFKTYLKRSNGCVQHMISAAVRWAGREEPRWRNALWRSLALSADEWHQRRDADTMNRHGENGRRSTALQRGWKCSWKRWAGGYLQRRILRKAVRRKMPAPNGLLVKCSVSNISTAKQTKWQRRNSKKCWRHHKAVSRQSDLTAEEAERRRAYVWRNH